MSRTSPTATPFQTLAEIPPELEGFANLSNANTRRAYRRDLEDFMAFADLQQPKQFRDVTRAHVIAWRDQLVRQCLANDTIRRKLTSLSSLSAYLCERHAVWHNPVLGVKRRRSMNREGVTPALGDHQARTLLQATAGNNALAREADIAKVQEWLGHSDISTMRMYDKRQSRTEDSPTFQVSN
jgi:site-specific recombinase XerD